ncbi:MAG: hypothetical protein GY786_19700 [Proteobacteria bacterium]|nr:hypothetical protein [Pseudomonadota bacterium]
MYTKFALFFIILKCKYMGQRTYSIIKGIDRNTTQMGSGEVLLSGRFFLMERGCSKGHESLAYLSGDLLTLISGKGEKG